METRDIIYIGLIAGFTVFCLLMGTLAVFAALDNDEEEPENINYKSKLAQHESTDQTDRPE